MIRAAVQMSNGAVEILEVEDWDELLQRLDSSQWESMTARREED